MIRFAEEMATHFAEAPVKEFIQDIFLRSVPQDEPLVDLEDCAKDGSVNPRRDFSDIHALHSTLRGATDEKAIYPLICELIQRCFDLATAVNNQPLVVCDTAETKADDAKTSHSQGKQDKRQLSPDLCVYRKIPRYTQYELRKSEREEAKLQQQHEERRKWLGKVDWALVKIFVEVKVKHDPFYVRKSQGNRMDLPIGGVESRGHISDYAARVRRTQHRTCTYSVVVHQHTVRFLRWDQVGGIVSEPFDFETDYMSFLRFFYFAAQMTDKQLGWDPTVERASLDDVALWNRVLAREENKEMKERLKSTSTFDSPNSRYTVTVNGDGPSTARQRWNGNANTFRRGPDAPQFTTPKFIIGRASVAHDSPTGRGTRGYIALDKSDEVFVFLKDSWRPDYSAAGDFKAEDAPDPEIVILADLHSKDVECIPDVVCGGDAWSFLGKAEAQCTLTQEYLPGYGPRIHTRLVLKQVGYPLQTYSSAVVLVIVVNDAFTAHRQAWEKAGILHRDISDQNIVIVYLDSGDPKGMLIDWDMSKRQKKSTTVVTQEDRSGTWHSMSALLTNFPQEVHGVRHDNESFVHVLRSQAWCFHKHTYSGMRRSLAQYVYNMYYECHVENGYYIGCEKKLDWVLMGDGKGPALLGYPTNSQPFLALLDELLAICKIHYRTVDLRSLNEGLQRLLTSNQATEASSKPLEAERLPSRIRTSRPRRKTPAVTFETESTVAAGVMMPLLNDHKAIAEAFERALSTPYGWREDKFMDQFKDLPPFSTVKETNSTRDNAAFNDSREHPSTASQGSRKRRKLDATDSVH